LSKKQKQLFKPLMEYLSFGSKCFFNHDFCFVHFKASSH